LIEYENKIMLPREKLELAKEMKGVLDPNCITGELSVMKKEIGRRELRWEQLNR
jgi:hypothetical protein